MGATTATAAVLHRLGDALQLEEIWFDSLGSREVRVRVRASGICRSDLTVSSTNHGFPLPLLLGHEIAGVVEEVGSEVTGLHPGDHVVGCPVNQCGKCNACRSGQPYRCSNHGATDRNPGESDRVTVGGKKATQFIGIGGFSTQVVMHENLVVPVPEEIPFDIACLLGCGVSTGLGAALNSAQVRHGDTVLVVGCGGVGLNVVQGARLAGARRIIAMDKNTEALELALQLGATDIINADSEDPARQAKELTSNAGVTQAFEVIGLPQTLELAMDALGTGGDAYLIGVQRPDEVLGIPFRHFFQQKSVHGVAMGSSIPHIHIPEYADLYLQGRLQLEALVAQRISLSEVNKGFDRLIQGGAARSVIIFD